MRPSHLSPKQIFDYACMDAETLYQKQGVSPAGLSQEEAEKAGRSTAKTAGQGERATPCFTGCEELLSIPLL